jgi:hypothetical protein
MDTLPGQLVTLHACTHEGVLQVQFVDLAL